MDVGKWAEGCCHIEQTDERHQESSIDGMAVDQA